MKQIKRQAKTFHLLESSAIGAPIIASIFSPLFRDSRINFYLKGGKIFTLRDLESTQGSTLGSCL
jgi:hypothetical protein